MLKYFSHEDNIQKYLAIRQKLSYPLELREEGGILISSIKDRKKIVDRK